MSRTSTFAETRCQSSRSHTPALVARQVRYEQLTFWLNLIGALLAIGFSVVFIVIFESTSSHSTVSFLAHTNLGQDYLPAFASYGVMAARFKILAIQLVNRREMSLLKRLRLSPLPAWTLLAADRCGHPGAVQRDDRPGCVAGSRAAAAISSSWSCTGRSPYGHWRH